MYQKKAFNRREQDYAMGLRRKLEEAEAMLQHLAPSRARSLALTKLDEALLWANVGIAEAGLQQGSSRAIRLYHGTEASTLIMLWPRMWMGSRCGQHGPGISRLMG